MENEPLQPTSPTPQSQLAEVQADYNALHSFLLALLLVLIVISGTIWYFFMKQTRNIGNDLLFLTPVYTNTVAQYQRAAPIIDETFAKMQAFGRTNPDFVQILAKYGLQPAGVPVGPAQPAVTRPPAAPAKK